MIPRFDTIRWVSVFLIGMATLGITIMVQQTATAARVRGEPRTLAHPLPAVEIVETAGGLHQTLVRSGRHGQVVVYLSRFLHFVPVEGAVPNGWSSFPIPSIDLVEVSSKRVDRKNVLWVIVQAGVAREIVHVLPDREYEKRRTEIGGPSPGIDIQRTAIVTHELGSRRTILADPPVFTEPVILCIDAAYLDEVDVDPTMDRLRLSQVETDFVVLNLALDNPDVSDVGRIRLAELAEILGDGS